MRKGTLVSRGRGEIKQGEQESKVFAWNSPPHLVQELSWRSGEAKRGQP